MVRTVVAAAIVLFVALPALAQEDFPRIQTSMGYANLGLNGVFEGNHSGFANETGFNLTPVWGLNNYMGIYTLGNGLTLVSDFVGGKASYRAARVVPYAQAGIGLGYFSQSTSFGTLSYGTKFGTKVGGGFDVPLSDTMAVKFEYSRIAFKFATTPTSSWLSGNNFSGGIVFTLSN